MKGKSRLAVMIGGLLLLATLVSAAALTLPATLAAPSAPVSSQPAPVSAPAPAPAPRVVDVTDLPAETPAADHSGAIALVTANRAFGDALYDDNALIDAVEITLLDRAIEIDGFRYLDQALVRDTIRQRYGREVSPEAGIVYGMDPPEGYYAILPRSYDYHEQTVTAVTEQADGTLLVTSQLLVLGLDDSDVHRVETTLAPAATAYGYIVTAATIVD